MSIRDPVGDADNVLEETQSMGEPTFFHWSDLMPEDVSPSNEVDLLFKLEGFNSYYREGLCEIEITGFLNPSTPITVGLGSRDALTEPKVGRAQPYHDKLCWARGVCIIDKNYYGLTAYPGSIRIYDLIAEKNYTTNTATLYFPLPEIDISSTYQTKIDPEPFPLSENEQQYVLDLYKAFQ